MSLPMPDQSPGELPRQSDHVADMADLLVGQFGIIGRIDLRRGGLRPGPDQGESGAGRTERGKH
jgi:hypothetical protein